MLRNKNINIKQIADDEVRRIKKDCLKVYITINKENAVPVLDIMRLIGEQIDLESYQIMIFSEKLSKMDRYSGYDVGRYAIWIKAK